jgi:hypothetical protein
MASKLKKTIAVIIACAYMYWGIVVAVDAGKSAAYIMFVTVPLELLSIILAAGIAYVLYAVLHNENKTNIY